MSLTDSIGADGGFVCLVDGDGEYSLQEEKMTQLMKHIDPTGNGDFSCVSIIGCQSTGKSTLLNRLFDTRFAMMDSGQGRSQTTKGLWLDAARNTKGLLVIDVEGTDSGERSTNQTKEKENFERQSILYALALSEIMIVNMWETDIGRWNGSNFGIMKTVFEVNMQLFRSKTKTQILFIIRDYNEEGTPFSSLRKRLLSELHGIWDTLQKPEEYKDVAMEDFFDIRFTYLPHFVYRRDKFEEVAANLRAKFSINEPDGYFDTEYHCEKSKSIPSSDFAQYSKNIWDTIRTNQDLNLPTQREMITTYRCDEIVAALLAEWAKGLELWQQRFQQNRSESDSLGSLEHIDSDTGRPHFARFGAELAKLVQQFDKQCEKYIKSIVDRKRQELIQKLYEPIVELMTTHVKVHYFNPLIREFDYEINSGLLPDEVTFGIMEKCQELTAHKIKAFHDQITALTETFPTKAISDEGLIAAMSKKLEEEFVAKLVDIVNAVRKQQLQALVSTTLGEFDARVDSKSTEIFTSGKPDMWQQLGQLFNGSISTCFSTTESELNALAETEEERIVTKKRIVESAQLIIFEKAQRFVEQIPIKLRDRFESLFVYHKGQLRVWKSSDDPRSIFENARDECLVMLRGFRTFNLQRHISPEYVKLLTETTTTTPALPKEEEGNENNSVQTLPSPLNRTQSVPQNLGLSFDPILISRDDLYRIESDFERKVQGHLQSAIVEVERIRNQTGLPSWVWAIFLFLGYDEILWALSNPFILFLLMLIGIGVFVLHQLHLLDPALTVAKAVTTRLFNEFTKVIDGSSGQPAPTQPQTGSSAPSNEIPSLTRQSTSQLNLDNIDTASQRSGSAAQQPTQPTPSNFDSASTLSSMQASTTNAAGSEVLSQNSLSRRRPGGYTTMTLNKKNMQQMMQQAMAQGYNNQ